MIELTRSDVAKMCRITASTVYWYARTYGIRYTVRKSASNGRPAMFFDRSAVKIINRLRADGKKPDKEGGYADASDFANHPLVTDPRCFKLSWWPDPLPDEDE